MTGKEVLRRLKKRGCDVVRQKGSHVRIRCKECQTTVPVHAGEDLPVGTLSAIERDLAACIGRGWRK